MKELTSRFEQDNVDSIEHAQSANWCLRSASESPTLSVLCKAEADSNGLWKGDMAGHVMLKAFDALPSPVCSA